jgi:allantoin racemase
VPSLLIINPNTSGSVSQLLQSHAQAAAGAGVDVRTLTARFGAPYIACEASYAVAGHAVLDTWAYALAQQELVVDSVLIGCFGDPGLMALRENSAIPVTGLAEASFIEAATYGRFAIVTGGERWKPILQRLAHSLGYGSSLAGIHTVEPSGAQLAKEPDLARTLLIEACCAAAHRFDVDALILGGAGLAGVAATIQAQVPVPVVDSVSAGVRQALAPARSQVQAATRRFEFDWCNVSPELSALGTHS